jgi:hypothetical protein
MKLYPPFAAILFVSIPFSIGCNNSSAPPASSSAGALTANTSINNLEPRPFEKHNLNSGGSHYLNQLIRPEIRAQLDEEPTGDADASYDPSTLDSGTPSEPVQSESAAEPQKEDADQQSQPGESEESFQDGSRLDTLKFAWAKKSFGEAIRSSPSNTGVIIVYADDNYFEVDRLMGYVEEGRDKIAAASEIGGETIQVVFGGYRAVPQVEMWILPEGCEMPEFKPDDRLKVEREN